ncbi:MAG TPA: type 1 glutamine amidotransferase domain-containing protein [Thermodesulfobacteriota bacterium]|nr:type 1 glutamine amidotransferase domain-containing protein [Thermodesulfobacteriota bacterium]
MELSGKRVGIFVENMYQEHEFWYSYLRMKETGAKVSIIGTGAKEYKSLNGIPAPGGLVFKSVGDLVNAESVSAADFDAVIIPGGFAPDYLRRSQAVLKIVRDCFEQKKIVATICHAGWVLASAGVAKGRTMTCLFSIKDDVINAGAKYVDQEVVRDGNLITSRLPDDLPAFLREIIAALKNQ